MYIFRKKTEDFKSVEVIIDMYLFRTNPYLIRSNGQADATRLKPSLRMFEGYRNTHPRMSNALLDQTAVAYQNARSLLAKQRACTLTNERHGLLLLLYYSTHFYTITTQSCALFLLGRLTKVLFWLTFFDNVSRYKI